MSSETEKQDTTPTVTVDLRPYGRILTFKAPEDVDAWVKKENDFWQPLLSPHQMSPLRNLHSGIYQSIRQYAAQWRQNLNNQSSSDQARKQIDSQLKNRYANGSIFTSDHTAAPFLEELADEHGQEVAGTAYAYLCDPPNFNFGSLTPDTFTGLVSAYLFLNDLKGAAESQHNAFSKLRSEYEENLLIQDQRSESIEASNQLLNQEFKDKLENHTTELSELHSSQIDEFKTLIDTNQAELKAIEETYDKKLALSKPVTYWKVKAQAHAKLRRTISGSLKWLAPLITILPIGLGFSIILTLPDNSPPSFWVIGIFITCASVGIWLLRILVKLLLSQLHLETDANERRVMIQTFLALIREGEPFSSEDKNAILQQLFKPTADGIVKDDAAPGGVISLLTKN